MLAGVCLSGCWGRIPESNVEPSPKVQQALSRENTAEAIDAELNERFKSMKTAANKLVYEDDRQIIVKHKYGETAIPKNPQRIVVVRMTDLMLALDVPMVAAEYTPNSYLYPLMVGRGITNISVNEDSQTINYEQVQALQPDLIIIRDTFAKGVYENLSKIAPTVAFNIRKTETALLALAKALGDEKRGEERLRQYYGKVKFYRLELSQTIGDSTVAMLRVMNREVRVYPYSNNDINRFMYDLLNLKPPAMVLNNDASTTNAISVESLPRLQADYLIVSAGYGANSRENSTVAAEKYRKLKEDAVWKEIPAVAKERVLEVDPALWNAHGIIAKELAMKNIYEAWGSR